MSRHDLLSQISSTAHSILSKLPSPTRRKTQPVAWSDAPHLQLSEPIAQLCADMARSGLPHQVRTLAHRKATELAALYQKNFEGLHRDMMAQQDNAAIASPMFDNLQRFYLDQFEKTVMPRFLGDALKAQAAHCPRSTVSSPKEKMPFNHEFTPFLVKYFERNAYPSASERKFLAQKSSMSPRQIEVWFQNHRNRAKKEGKILKRSTSNSTFLEESFKNLESRSTAFQEHFSTDDSSTSEDSDLDDDINEPMTCPLSAPAPPHAFPNPYSPQSRNDPFPSVNGRFLLPEPQWERKPSSRILEMPSCYMDMDELTIMFATKLHLREANHQKQGFRKVREIHSTPWFAATVTTPLPAPLPALVKQPSLPSRVASHAPAQVSFDTQSLTCTPRLPIASKRSRKVNAIPKRRPTTLQSPFYGTDSRSSSLSSITSSSSSSSSIDEPITPPLSATHHVPIAPQDLDLFTHLFNLESDSLSDSLFYPPFADTSFLKSNAVQVPSRCSIPISMPAFISAHP